MSHARMLVLDDDEYASLEAFVRKRLGLHASSTRLSERDLARWFEVADASDLCSLPLDVLWTLNVYDVDPFDQVPVLDNTKLSEVSRVDSWEIVRA